MNTDATSGIDVSSKTLDVTVLRANSDKRKCRKFDNDAVGHRQLIEWLAPFNVTRIVCEATGVYHLDLAFALTDAGMPLMVVNPRQVKRFIEARARNVQTDKVDANELAEFARRMDFEPWKAPSIKAFELHKLGRAIGQMTKRRTAMLNRLHAAAAAKRTPRSIVKSFENEIKFLDRQRELLSKEAHELIDADPDLTRKLELLTSVPGIAEVSALAILAELIVLPADLAGKAWVKYAGLDPMSKQSGSSVNTKAHIAKRGNARLRGALYMPAMNARQRDPTMRAFAEHLIAKHKQPIQAIVAVQRKLLLSIHAMFRTNTTWHRETAQNEA